MALSQASPTLDRFLTSADSLSVRGLPDCKLIQIVRLLLLVEELQTNN